MTAAANPLPRMVNGLGRRARLDLHQPAERAIRDALVAVEALGGDPLLTDAVNKLSEAQDLVADWLEGGQKPELSRVLSLEEQVVELRKKYPAAKVEARQCENDSKWTEHLITIPDWPLPPGYDRATCTVYFVVPNGYPFGHPPERFYTDALRLKNGARPEYARPLHTDARMGAHPEAMGSFPAPDGTVIWFWKVQSWNAFQNTLKTYASVVKARLDKPEAGKPYWDRD